MLPWGAGERRWDNAGFQQPPYCMMMPAADSSSFSNYLNFSCVFPLKTAASQPWSDCDRGLNHSYINFMRPGLLVEKKKKKLHGLKNSHIKIIRMGQLKKEKKKKAAGDFQRWFVISMVIVKLKFLFWGGELSSFDAGFWEEVTSSERSTTQ